MLAALIPLLCVNQYNLSYDDYVHDVEEAERMMVRAEYSKVHKALTARMHPSDAALDARAADLWALWSVRSKEGDVAAAVKHFKARQKANPKDVRFKAWLAEAQLAAGESTHALALVNELRERDLMPDAFAYVTLAKLSIGPARTSAIETCRKRAKVKSICNVPKTT